MQRLRRWGTKMLEEILRSLGLQQPIKNDPRSPSAALGGFRPDLMGAAASMLQASGPSRMPIGLGQVIGAGMQGFSGGRQQMQQQQQQQQQQQALQQASQVMGQIPGIDPATSGVLSTLMGNPQTASMGNNLLSSVLASRARREEREAEARERRDLLERRFELQTGRSRPRSVS